MDSKLVLLLLGVLLSSSFHYAEAQQATTCAGLAPCLRFTDSCLADGTRQVCLRIIDATVSSECPTTEFGTVNTGTEDEPVIATTGLCTVGFPATEVTVVNLPVCTIVSAGSPAVFNYDTIGVVAAPLSTITITREGDGPKGVSCTAAAVSSSCAATAAFNFQISVPTSSSCACQCTAWVTGTCSVTCGSGIAHQTRACVSQTSGVTCSEPTSQPVECTGSGGSPCPPVIVTPAPTTPAPVTIATTCQCLTWGNWATCSSTCGSGQRMRTRACFRTSGSGSCPSIETGTGSCNTQACPNCPCSQWTPWSCSVTCGNGLETRTRSCVGNNCPTTRQDRTCTRNPCSGSAPAPVPAPASVPASSGSINGGWSPWSTWGSCSAPFTCDGSRQRLRYCTNPPPSGNGAVCSGTATETGECDPILCFSVGINVGGHGGGIGGGRGRGGGRGQGGGREGRRNSCRLARNPKRCRRDRRRQRRGRN